MNPDSGYGTPVQNDVQILSKWGGGGTGLASYQVGVTADGFLYFAVNDGHDLIRAVSCPSAQRIGQQAVSGRDADCSVTDDV